MNKLIVGDIPGPVVGFDNKTNLQNVKIQVLIARVNTLQSVCALQAAEIVELRRALAGCRELADELAQELEAVYGLQDQGACALAAAAAAEAERGD